MAEETVDLHERLKQKIGRPSRIKSVAVRFAQHELKTLTLAAEGNGMTLREWSRDVLLREARRMNGDPVFTEIVATRTMLNNVLGVIARGQIMTQEGFNYMLEDVRTTKHVTACEVMQQYTPSTEKEK